MDSFELNKILGAILGTLLFVMGVGFLAEAIYSPSEAGPGYALPEPADTGEGNGDSGQPVAAVVDIGTLLAAADPKAGEAAAKKCTSCHDFTEGGPNKTGPNLYDVVERKIASHPGFAYSDALMAHANDTWTYENLNQWLISPKGWAPGTKMTYAGDKDDKDRANIIAYLSTLSKSPKSFPAPANPVQGDTNTAPSNQTVDATSSAEQVIQTPNTTDPNNTNSPGTGTTTETPAGTEEPTANTMETGSNGAAAEGTSGNGAGSSAASGGTSSAPASAQASSAPAADASSAAPAATASSSAPAAADASSSAAVPAVPAPSSSAAPVASSSAAQ